MLYIEHASFVLSYWVLRTFCNRDPVCILVQRRRNWAGEGRRVKLALIHISTIERGQKQDSDSDSDSATPSLSPSIKKRNSSWRNSSWLLRHNCSPVCEMQQLPFVAGGAGRGRAKVRNVVFKHFFQPAEPFLGAALVPVGLRVSAPHPRPVSPSPCSGSPKNKRETHAFQPNLMILKKTELSPKDIVWPAQGRAMSPGQGGGEDPVFWMPHLYCNWPPLTHDWPTKSHQRPFPKLESKTNMV